MELRKYQLEAVEKLNIASQKQLPIALLHLATGTGKTVIFSTFLLEKLKNNPEKKVLIVAHRKELLTQARDKINIIQKHLGTDFKIIFDNGENKITNENYKKANIIISSIQSIGRGVYVNKKWYPNKRLKQYIPQDFQLIIIDETHHVVSSSYLNLLNYFGVLYTAKSEGVPYWNKECMLLGVTATPLRSKKGETLKQVFPEITYRYTLKDGIRDKYLANIKSFICKTGIKMGRIKEMAGDYNAKELSQKINIIQRNLFIVDKWKQYCENEKTIIFALDIEHTISIAEAFKQNGIDARWLAGLQNNKERDELLESFQNNEFIVLVNCMILTEGFDDPSIKNIIIARPTKSPVLYTQMVGRGTRMYKGKTFCRVLDIVDKHAHNQSPHTMIKELGLQEGKLKDFAVRILKRNPEIEGISVAEIIQKYEDAFKRNQLVQPDSGTVIDKGFLVEVINEYMETTIPESKYAWVCASPDNWILQLKSDHYVNGYYIDFASIRCEKVYYNEYELSVFGVVNGEKRYKNLGLAYSVKEIDAYVKNLLDKLEMPEILFVKTSNWRNMPASELQISYFVKLLKKSQNNAFLSEKDLEELTKGDLSILLNLFNFEKTKEKINSINVD